MIGILIKCHSLSCCLTWRQCNSVCCHQAVQEHCRWGGHGRGSHTDTGLLPPVLGSICSGQSSRGSVPIWSSGAGSRVRGCCWQVGCGEGALVMGDPAGWESCPLPASRPRAGSVLPRLHVFPAWCRMAAAWVAPQVSFV